ncbi:hypothetical protein RHSIM_Rhsim08G0137200 [Rhododendron simsii]|uniref:Uncharacterized protein n=1 Tax=Rhododendron simsii TaxID=118357 RepID=A0A834GQS9_RHOSS|nr:hypothetical protein RHSIM_Rhsim08G0137200 [Rhododendron simsii]
MPSTVDKRFFLVRNDETVDFSFRKCVDHILPLAENMQIKSDVNKALGGGGRGHRGRGGAGRRSGHGCGQGGLGRGGRSRNRGFVPVLAAMDLDFLVLSDVLKNEQYLV